MKKAPIFALLSVCSLPATVFSQITDFDPYVKLNPTGPQTISGGPLNIIAHPDNPGLQCDLCLRSPSRPGWNGGAELEMFSSSSTPGNFPTHFVANYWHPPDGASVGNFYPVYFATEANGNATWGTYTGVEFDSGNGGGLNPVYGNWEGARIQMVNVTSDGIGVTVPGFLTGLAISMPAKVKGGAGTAGVRVDGLPSATSLAFYTPNGSFQTGQGNITTQNGVMRATSFQANGGATWTSGTGVPHPATCSAVGSLYSRTDASSAADVLYVCTSGGWVAK